MPKKRAKISPPPKAVRVFSPPRRFTKARPAPLPLQVRNNRGWDPSESPLKELERNFKEGFSHPKISVVIVNHNGVDALWNCLFALNTQTYPSHEVILVDNASTDASVSFVKANYPKVQILECQENFGPAMGRNLGIKTATGHLVVLLDPDTVVTPDWLDRMVWNFQKSWPKFGMLVAPFQPEAEGKRDSKTLNFLGTPVSGFLPHSLELFCPGPGAVLFPRFLAPDGPFDADYFLCREDAYLGWKFRLAGQAIAKSPEAKIFQKGEDSNSDFPEWKTIYYSNRNRWLNLLLFYEWENLLKILPWVLLDGVVRLAASLGTGFGAFWGTSCAMGWIASHPLLIFQKRRALQERRKVPDSHILRRLSGRVVPDSWVAARFLNFLSLAYCGFMGLEVLEFQD